MQSRIFILLSKLCIGYSVTTPTTALNKKRLTPLYATEFIIAVEILKTVCKMWIEKWIEIPAENSNFI